MIGGKARETYWANCDGLGRAAPPAAVPPSTSGSRTARAAHAAGWAVSGALAVSALFALRPSAPAEPPTVFQFNLAAEGGVQSALSLSPDGRHLATFGAGADGKDRLSLRTLGEGAAHHVLELAAIYWWAWTPDNALLVGVPQGLQRIDAQSGATLFQPGNWVTGSGTRVALGDAQIRRGSHRGSRISSADMVRGWAATRRHND